MQQAVERQIAQDKRELHLAAQRLDSLSPLSVLGRGYAIARDGKTGKPISSAVQVDIRQELDVLLQDGSRKTTVKEVHGGVAVQQGKIWELGK